MLVSIFSNYKSTDSWWRCKMVQPLWKTIWKSCVKQHVYESTAESLCKSGTKDYIDGLQTFWNPWLFFFLRAVAEFWIHVFERQRETGWQGGKDTELSFAGSLFTCLQNMGQHFIPCRFLTWTTGILSLKPSLLPPRDQSCRRLETGWNPGTLLCVPGISTVP